MPEGFMNVKKEENNMNTNAQRENRSERPVNRTGIPIQLKEQLEQSTGMFLDDVRVHYNSPLPERLDALAYTRGNQVEIAPGQENCLPHELGHVVQQKLGLVRANARHSSGVMMNTDAGLEQQADEIGAGKRVAGTAVSASDKIVQRKLFIRTSQNIVKKDDLDMTEPVKGAVKKEEKKQEAADGNAKSAPLPEESEQPTDKTELENKYGNQKIPQNVGSDTGYLEITEATEEIIINGYINWLRQRELPLTTEEQNAIVSKIHSMIIKSVEYPEPERIYDKHINDVNKVPRLEKGDTKMVSYYFETLEEFYTYVYLSINNRFAMLNSLMAQTPKGVYRPWLKINVVNTGAGDAIVMTLPDGYLIVDLGTNLNILLNYLGLRKDKRDGSTSGNRGIPLTGKTCIVITHNHADHKGCDLRQFSYDKDELRKDVIIGYDEYCKGKIPNSEFEKRRERLDCLLQSGGFMVYDFQTKRKSNKNTDSLVIARRVGNSEAVILSGDQESARLGEVVDKLAEQGELVNHMFIKVPHHGSKENNNAEIINKFSELGVNPDFVVSSGMRFKHPDAKMFANENRLYRQGTLIEYNRILYENGQMDNVLKDTRFGKVFYTANLNKEPGMITLGSVVYKSNGEYYVTYSKRYDDQSISAKTKTDDDVKNERDMIISMFKQIGIAPDSEGNTLNPDSNNMISEEHQMSPYMFYKLEAKQQVGHLKELNDCDRINQFLEGLDRKKLMLKETVEWQNFFKSTCLRWNWGQNYYFIMTKTCSEGKLYEFFCYGLEQNAQYLWKNILDAVFIYEMEPTKYIRLLIARSNNIDSSELSNEEELSISSILMKAFEDEQVELDKMGLDANIIYELLCNKVLLKNGDRKSWINERIAILQHLEINNQIEFFKFFLTCGSLLPDELVYVLRKLVKKGMNILIEFPTSFFLEILNIYPQCAEEIYEVYKISRNEMAENIVDALSNISWELEEAAYELQKLPANGLDLFSLLFGSQTRSQSEINAILNEYPEYEEVIRNAMVKVGEESEDVDWFALNSALEIQISEWDSPDQLEGWLKHNNIDFITLINNLAPDILYQDAEGKNIIFCYAYEKGIMEEDMSATEEDMSATEEDMSATEKDMGSTEEYMGSTVEYMSALLEITCKYDITEESIFCRKYLYMLAQLDNNLFFTLLTPGCLQPSTLERYYNVLTLNPEEITDVFSVILNNLNILINLYPAMVSHLLGCLLVQPQECIPDFIINWLNAVPNKFYFYSLIAYADLKLLSIIFTLHCTRAQASGKIEEDIWIILDCVGDEKIPSLLVWITVDDLLKMKSISDDERRPIFDKLITEKNNSDQL